MNTLLLKVSLRCGAIYVPSRSIAHVISKNLTHGTINLLLQLRKAGYSVTEPLLHVLNGTPQIEARIIVDTINDIMGCSLNWAPLMKDWNTTVGHSWQDVKDAEFRNLLGNTSGVRLSCGHTIPEDLFDLNHYNGCPLCGTPFATAPGVIFNGQGSKLKQLKLWTDDDLMEHFTNLLNSPVALDATQVDSLKILLAQMPLPATANVRMKETLMLVIDTLVEAGKDDEAGRLIKSPVDVMRYLWYKHTGYLQIVPPRVLIDHAAASADDHRPGLSRSNESAQRKREELKLKYDRATCRRVAQWMNSLPMDVRKACEEMHPRREMWVRFIRALRLPEYAKRKGYDYLRNLLDVFYRKDYAVLQGWIEEYKLRYDFSGTMSILKQYPGRFARCLFSTLLWFGEEDRVIKAFSDVASQLPPRLLITLGMYADLYFDPKRSRRTIKTVLGEGVNLPANPRLMWYTEGRLLEIANDIKKIYQDVMRERFAAMPHKAGTTIYIDPDLNYIPVSVGDRASTIQDVNAVPQGTTFKLESTRLRVFMQWGKGLPAGHLDMDLSCAVVYPHSTEVCAYFNLNIPGANHSGDIQYIPDKVGTAEYVELDLAHLQQRGAKYVIFTCNAYSYGDIAPNLVLGWMDSKFPMQVQEHTGVAYDPSCVQHQVRVTKDTAKGLVFGVLNVFERKMIWLENAFEGQNIQGLNLNVITDLLDKLAAKTTIGKMLSIKAEAQKLRIVPNADAADEVYTQQWAQDQAAVAKLLLD